MMEYVLVIHVGAKIEKVVDIILVWIVEGFCFGLGFALAWYLVGIPFKRWAL